MHVPVEPRDQLLVSQVLPILFSETRILGMLGKNTRYSILAKYTRYAGQKVLGIGLS